MHKHTLLKDLFGHNNFKPKQEEAIDAILSGKDVLMILPTGGGKSLAYQLPSLMMQGTTIVISPLIALMQDQVQNLKDQNIQAAMLASNQNVSENDAVIRSVLQGQIKLLYISPERLNTSKMQEILKKITINFFVIDEAHCISEWGHEFREDYRFLGVLKQLFPQKAIAAFTATATLHVQKDIQNLLALQKPLILKGQIFRSNLGIHIKQRVKNGYSELLEFLQDRKEQQGIVYMPSRAKCEELSAYLNVHGFVSDYYHAGMENARRDSVYFSFVRDEIHIIVATIAFGMGIDKSDIRFVVHMSMPKTIENYFQEIGRAGRDGEYATVLMLYAAQDLLYAKMRAGEIQNAAYRQNMLEKLSSVYRFVSSETCRHQSIARYFEDEIKACEDHCDNCLEPEVIKEDISWHCKKILSCVYRTEQKFGKTYLIDILTGSSNKKILENGHDQLSVYGIGKDLHKKQWFVIVDRLLEIEALRLGEFQVLLLTQIASDILKSLQTVNIHANRLMVKKNLVAKSVVQMPNDFDVALFETLKALRTRLAKENNVPAYIICGDKTLKEMAKMKPKTDEQMLAINGIGQKKLEQYGNYFLQAIRA
ncbi:MAG: DNA helicase RecQ [Sulfurospirillum sp.]|nr:DNA helicase RecQ [Sulfurospirillum sp.]